MRKYFLDNTVSVKFCRVYVKLWLSLLVFQTTLKGTWIHFCANFGTANRLLSILFCCFTQKYCVDKNEDTRGHNLFSLSFSNTCFRKLLSISWAFTIRGHFKYYVGITIVFCNHSRNYICTVINRFYIISTNFAFLLPINYEWTI